MINPLITYLITLLSIVLLTILKNLFPYVDQPLTKLPDQLRNQYDYIIIGAGSAGSVLANRLTENATKTVLVIEAGVDESTIIYSNMPRMAPLLLGSPMDWSFMTGPEKSCCDYLNQKRIHLAQGKALGGGSSMNWMLYVRGHPDDYNAWAALGNEGWSFNDVLPYFIKSEQAHFAGVDLSLHGTDGPLPVTQAQPNALTDTLFQAIQTLGMTVLNDTTGTENNGFGLSLFTVYNGERQSTAKTYLRPAMTRKNLDVVNNALVDKILFDCSSEVKATGVQFQWIDGVKHEIKSSNVILSAGAISSPKILMLSGIGPENLLEDMGIPVILDNPNVGQHLIDHPVTLVFYSIDGNSGVDDPLALIENFNLYLSSRQGYFATPFIDSLGFLSTGLNPNSTGNDLQLYFMTGVPSNDLPIILGLLNYEPTYIEKVAAATLGQVNRTVLVFLVSLLHPNSRGTVTLVDDIVQSPPAVDERFFDNDQDAKISAYGMRIIMKIMETDPFKKYNPKLIDIPMEGCEQVTFLSDEYLECVVKKRSFGNFHTVSTCRMGKDRSDSVVSFSSFKVHDVQGLRIVDASVFPAITGCNTNAPVIMVAEKAADIIKAQDFN